MPGLGGFIEAVRTGRRSTSPRGWAPCALALWLGLGLWVVPLAAWSQEAMYQGRLTDGSGSPLLGPVTFDLAIYPDAGPGGTALYQEVHFSVELSEEGVFSVPLGGGNTDACVFDSMSCDYDASLFAGTDPRYLEVRVNGELLFPRQRIGTVPTALVAEALAPSATRFEACADGLTVADHDTGLVWEKKVGTPVEFSSRIICETEIGGCPDPHDVANAYEWSEVAPEPNGNAYTDFLARLNGDFDPEDATACFANDCSWRLPKIAELKSILIGPEAAPGQDTSCLFGPCIDPAFAAVGGPTASATYWSASRFISDPGSAWVASFGGGFVFTNGLTGDKFVRAVRAGSCH